MRWFSTTNGINKVAAASFNANASLYAKIRPSYPPEAVDHILAQLHTHSDCRILDLAAGTGIFTKMLHERTKAAAGIEILSVEPVSGMRRAFSESCPALSVVPGSATSIPFPDNHFDLVTVAQAFHWFANTESLREIHRVLKNDGKGTLALIWNMESNSVEWMKKVRDLAEVHDGDVPQFRKNLWQLPFEHDASWGDSGSGKGLFSPLTRRDYTHEMLVSREEVWSRILSKSYITSLNVNQQDELKQKIMSVLSESSSFCIDRDRDSGQRNRGKTDNRESGDMDRGDTERVNIEKGGVADACARQIIDVAVFLTKTR